MKVVKLGNDSAIDGVFCRAGTLVQVEDGYDLDDGDEVIAAVDVAARQRHEKELIDTARTAKERRQKEKKPKGK